MGDALPAAVLTAYGLVSTTVRRVSGGLIHDTYFAEQGDHRVVLQRVHRVFEPQVHADIAAVTAHLVRKGVPTPTLVATRDGAQWLEVEGRVWRALSYIDGQTLHKCRDPQQAFAAFRLIASFHRAVADLPHVFQFVRAGVHDTSALVQRLRELGASSGTLGSEILRAAERLTPIDALPKRVTHGDLKISNIRFARETPPRALCLLDLDTLGRQNMAYELGDALRSWCNPSGEDGRAPALDLDLVAAALGGYVADGCDLLSPAEIAALVPGAETVTVELATRFCVDVVEDRYFGWDATRYATRREHNLARAHSMLALTHFIHDQRDRLQALVDVTL